MIIVTEISVFIVGFLLCTGMIQYIGARSRIQREQDILECALYAREQEEIYARKQLALKEEAERIQKTKMFYLDFRISHGSAFGGFCATMNDGRRKKGLVRLDHILLYGKHPSGKEFTYYIEDQNIEIGATDDPNILFVRSSDGSRFEIRQNGQGRDEGEAVSQAEIRKGILYYIILESKHEISIKAVKGC